MIDNLLSDLRAQMMADRRIHQALLTVKSEPELFQRICDVLKALSHIRLVWIGLVEEGSFEVKPVAQAGFEEGYLSSIRVTWDNSKYGMGPTGTAIKTRLPVVMRDIASDPKYEPWRKEAVQRGYASSAAVPLMSEGDVLGALNVYSQRKNAFDDEEVQLLLEVAGDIAVGVKSLRLETHLKQTVEHLQRLLSETVEAVGFLIESRDPYTAGHQRRVSQLAVAIERAMGLPEEQIEGVRIAGLLHDIGKISVPAEILSRPGTLNVYEFGLIRGHPSVGYDALIKIQFLWPVAKVVLQHHERLDGSGYPDGLSGEEILLHSRVIAVADVVEAMASHRPYRPALGIDKALEEIAGKKDILYDSDVVNACCKLFAEGAFAFD